MTSEPFEKWIKTESEQWFLLHSRPGVMSMDLYRSGDLGTGTAQTIMRFQTAAERSYFIEVDDLRGRVGALLGQIEYLKTVKGANWNLRDVRARKKAGKL